VTSGAVEPLDWPPHHVSRWSPAQFQQIADRHRLDLVTIDLEDPDLSHARVLALATAPASVRRLGRDERSLLAVAWMHASVGPRRHARAIASGAYARAHRHGHAMLAEFRREGGGS
jgi:hypothetical protein